MSFIYFTTIDKQIIQHLLIFLVDMDFSTKGVNGVGGSAEPPEKTHTYKRMTIIQLLCITGIELRSRRREALSTSC